MGATNRFFILIAALAIGAVMGGQAIFSRIPLDQALLKARSGIPSPGQVTAGSEDSVIPLERLGGVWVARVELNDLHEARLIVDTGATFTTISEDLAFDAGVRTDSANPHINLFTAGGKVQAEMGVARRIRVGNAGRDDVRVVVHTIPNLPAGI
ncbi:MAG: retropepsin-like domain-containing protein, partial [Nitrospirota bacterium]|nr:retropepsin-like domain-containing protein [Nitrospirota bacterium]